MPVEAWCAMSVVAVVERVAATMCCARFARYDACWLWSATMAQCVGLFATMGWCAAWFGWLLAAAEEVVAVEWLAGRLNVVRC